MNCWHCGTKLIWGGEHEDSEYSMETNLSCPNCGSFVSVYFPKETNVPTKTSK
jgi:DNA-directed RNA polymerase subunit RPC12/RpoP